MTMMDRRALTLCLLALAAAPVSGDEFDRVEGDRVERLIRDGPFESRASLTFGQLEALPQALPDTRTAFLLVKTGQGNYARLLASPALRKPPEGNGPAAPVLLIERFDTFEPGRSATRPARGSNVPLFDGFQLDLDTGFVVPEGQGGDLVFRAGGTAGPRVEPTGGARLYAPTRPIPAEPGQAGPTPGKVVVPHDFAGRYKLFADGRWSGLLEIQVADDRAVTGHFRSEPNGTSYPVSGEVSAEVPNKVAFKVKFPRTEQAYEGLLWTDGKWAIAGTFQMLERPFGFFAVREGVSVEIPR
jgi:hypothetical protein